MRAVWPLISITVTTMSSPSTILSPGRRVMISIASVLLGTGWPRRRVSQPQASRAYGRSGGLLRRRGQLREQRRAQLGRRRLVEQLVAGAAHDRDRGAQVGGEVLQPLARAHGYVDGRVVTRK